MHFTLPLQTPLPLACLLPRLQNPYHVSLLYAFCNIDLSFPFNMFLTKTLFCIWYKQSMAWSTDMEPMISPLVGFSKWNQGAVRVLFTDVRYQWVGRVCHNLNFELLLKGSRLSIMEILIISSLKIAIISHMTFAIDWPAKESLDGSTVLPELVCAQLLKVLPCMLSNRCLIALIFMLHWKFLSWR